MSPKLMNFKVGKCPFGNFFSIIYSYLKIAFRAQNYAIIDCSLTSEFLRDSGGDVASPVFTNKPSATPSTLDTKPISGRLPALCSVNSSSGEIDHIQTPSIEWRKGRSNFPLDYWYFQNDKWTGIRVERILYLDIFRQKLWAKRLKLEHKSFRITHCPNCVPNILHDLTECPTLKEAKKIAEWYYREWLDVNSPEKGEG